MWWTTVEIASGTTESSLLRWSVASSEASRSCTFWSWSLWLGKTVSREKIVRAHVQYLSFFEVFCIDAFNWLDAEVERVDWAENLIYRSDFCFVFEIHSPVELGEPR